ncbi:MAG: NADH-quinone oxidoreductase subunit NuoE [Candidatus Auribacterota bacterium]|jgi:NADH:ubiquinone oxidoreductase subunit E|nr:NADH-quinone oxidoreductase subunit NuoE [Candidatus Auribacterota bacterium]
MDVSNKEKFTLSSELIEYIDSCKQQAHFKSFLINVLQRIQDIHGYLPQCLMEETALRLGVPTAKVYGVATFYHMFRLEPQGKHTINICLGTACYVKGAQRVLDAFKSHLNIDIDETTEDLMFTLKAARCVGTCGLAPVVMIDNDVYAKVTPEDVLTIITKYRQS